MFPEDMKAGVILISDSSHPNIEKLCSRDGKSTHLPLHPNTNIS
jgi:hypothetical protein